MFDYLRKSVILKPKFSLVITNGHGKQFALSVPDSFTKLPSLANEVNPLLFCYYQGYQALGPKRANHIMAVPAVSLVFPC